MSLPFYDNMPGPERRDKFNQMWQLFQQAVEEAVGPQGWSPKLSLVSDGSRRVLQIVDWVGGEGTKPVTSGYIGATGIVATAALAVDIRGSIGATGPSNTLAIGTVTSAASPSATITGASPNQTLNLVLPKGDKGDTGNTGPANTLTIGTVTTGSASATITGTAPAQVLNLTIPQGIQGIQGPQGPKGDTGNTGATGPQGIQGVQGVNGDAGWSPIFATVADGVRYVLQVTDWAGGAGTKPAVGKYVGATGFVDTIASGVNIRGPAGTGSVSPSGTIAADDLAAFVDSLGTSIKAVKPANLPVSTATQNALNLKANLASPSFAGTVVAASSPASTGIAALPGSNSGFESRSQGSGGTAGSATIAFHRQSAHAVHFGLDTDNKLKVGGWSLGTNAYAIYHEGNKPAKADVGLGSVDNTSDASKSVLSATKLTTARTINGVSFDGTANITVADSTKLPLTGGTVTGELVSSSANSFRLTQGNYGVFWRNDGSNTYLMVTASGDPNGTFTAARPLSLVNSTGVASINGNAATATKLATARTINGVSFDGSANISVPVDWSSVTGKPAVIAAGADAASARSAIGAGTSNLTLGTTASTALAGNTVVIPEAPSDGKIYGRKNATWAEVAAGDSTPPGTVIFYAKNSPPTGYLKANGALVSRTTYAALFAAIGTTFGGGDGSTTFALPDLRGQFLRGWVDNGSVDSGRAFGSGQSHAYLNHAHTAFGSTDTTGAHTHTISPGPSSYSGTSGSSNGVSNIGSSATTSSAGDHTHTVTVTVNNSTTGSTETRPVNVALLACIKF